MGTERTTPVSHYVGLSVFFVFGLLCSAVFGLFLSVFLSFLSIDPWFILTTLTGFLLWQIVPSAVMRTIWRRIAGPAKEQPQQEAQEERLPPYGTALLLGITIGFMFQIIKFGAF